jgi:hypothetical protein
MKDVLKPVLGCLYTWNCVQRVNNLLGCRKEPVSTFTCEFGTSQGLLTWVYLWPMNYHIEIAEIVSRVDGFLDELPLDRVSNAEVTKASICGGFYQVFVLVGARVLRF